MQRLVLLLALGSGAPAAPECEDTVSEQATDVQQCPDYLKLCSMPSIATACRKTCGACPPRRESWGWGHARGSRALVLMFLADRFKSSEAGIHGGRPPCRRLTDQLVE